jgi:hypothetical protein
MDARQTVIGQIDLAPKQLKGGRAGIERTAAEAEIVGRASLILHLHGHGQIRAAGEVFEQATRPGKAQLVHGGIGMGQQRWNCSH